MGKKEKNYFPIDTDLTKMSKICSRCGNKKTLDKFKKYKYRNRPREIYVHSTCLECAREYHREWKRNRVKRIIQNKSVPLTNKYTFFDFYRLVTEREFYMNWYFIIKKYMEIKRNLLMSV